MTTPNTRVLVAALGSTGDVNPMLGIASELRRRGHDVVFLANPVFSRLAEAAGLSFTPLGTVREYEFIWNRRTWQWWRCMDTAFREGWVPHLRPLYEAIRSLVSSSPAIIVANIVAAGAQVACEKLGLPLVVVSPSSLVFQNLDEFPDYGPLQRSPRWLGRPVRRLFYRFGDAFVDFWIAKGWNALRAELDLPATRRIFSRWMSAGHSIIGLWPEWWAKPQTGWPSQLVLTGFLDYDRSELGTEGEAPIFGDANPPLVFTCGSAMTHARAFAEVAAGVRRILRRRVLVVADRAFELPPAQRAEVECSAYVPFRRLLPQAAAVVHHGGIGTCAASLAAGIPQVIVPLAFDQFDNAERSERLGVARRVPRFWFRPKRVARLAEELMSSKEVRTRCRQWQAKMDSGAALQRACDAVESSASRHSGR